eukprot:g4448.t1
MWLLKWHKNDEWPLRLAEGVGEKLLNEVESNLGMSLPLDVKEVYRMHNGQNNPSGIREFDSDTIIQNSGIDTDKVAYYAPMTVSELSIATPMFLDLQTVLKRTIKLRDHYNHMRRNMDSRKRMKREKEKERRGFTDMDAIYSSIVYAEISCGSLQQLLLLKCDTHDVYLWEYPSRLIQIPTKSKYGWFAIWLEGLTGFDENENPCQVPLSWYLMQNRNRTVPLLNEYHKKVEKRITLSGVECRDCMSCGFSYYTRLKFSAYEFSEKDIRSPKDRGIYRGPQLCSIASKSVTLVTTIVNEGISFRISKPLICHLSSKYEYNKKEYWPHLPKWYLSIRFESVESSEDLAPDRSQDTHRKMKVTKQRGKQEHSQSENDARSKSKFRKRDSIKQSIPKRKKTCRALSQQISRYYK